MTLENLFQIKQLKREAVDKREFSGLLSAATDRLKDAENKSLSYSSRFDLAYNAVHGFALAALRASGYRSDKRYLVFQCLSHTTEINKVHIRLFAKCHEKRNLAEYEGHYEVDEQLLTELIANGKELKKHVERIELLSNVFKMNRYQIKIAKFVGWFGSKACPAGVTQHE
jgi:hypothetical protein